MQHALDTHTHKSVESEDIVLRYTSQTPPARDRANAISLHCLAKAAIRQQCEGSAVHARDNSALNADTWKYYTHIIVCIYIYIYV